MRLLQSLVLATLLATTASVFAAEPLFVVKSVELNQPADVVWKKVSDFGDLGAWHPAVAKTEIVAGKSSHAGAKRVLTLQDGGKVNETLTAFNAKSKSYSYKITDGVLPVTDYASTVSVHSNGDGKSVVVWESHFLPKAPADEKASSEAIKGVYDGGLNQLKTLFQ
ncbi:SRPBCC family protein [Methylophilus sp. 5]|uniref:SRPBCC family protein n=1 Tax=Methylophilus sp. 5 TaxID=1112274 RepID=UPI00048BC36D|nr:SRPBCC family protein [Methylophilus sp. 5]